MNRLLQVFIALACIALVNGQVTPSPTPPPTPSPTPEPTPSPANCSFGTSNYHYPTYDGSMSSVSNADGLVFTVAFPNAAMEVYSGFEGAGSNCNMTFEYYDRPDPWSEIYNWCDGSVTVSSGPISSGILGRCGFTSVNNADGSTGSRGRFKLKLVERAAIIRGITVNRTMEYALLLQVNFAATVNANSSSVQVYGAATAQVVVTEVLFDSVNYGATLTLTSSVQNPYIFSSLSYYGTNPQNFYTMNVVSSPSTSGCIGAVTTSCVQRWTIYMNATNPCNGGATNMNVDSWGVTFAASCDSTRINCTGTPSPILINATFGTSSSNFCPTVIGTVTPTLTLTAYSGDNLIPQSSFVFGTKTYFRALMDSPVEIEKFRITEIRVASGAASSITGPIYINTYDSAEAAAFWDGTNSPTNSFSNNLAIDTVSSVNTTSPHNYFWIIFDSSLSSATGDNPTDTTIFISTRIKYAGTTGSATREVAVMKIKNQNSILADTDATPSSMTASATFSVLPSESTTNVNSASSASTTSNLAVIAVAAVGGAIAVLSVFAIVAIRRRRSSIEKQQNTSSINLVSAAETPATIA